MTEPNPLALNDKILNYIDEMKTKAVVSIKDLEKYYDLLIYLNRDISRLHKSREKWKEKYKDVKKKGQFNITHKDKQNGKT